jgi:hypothetical protein
MAEEVRIERTINGIKIRGLTSLATPLNMAPDVRFELTTHGLTVRCSNQLS